MRTTPFEELPDPANPLSIVEAISRLSRFSTAMDIQRVTAAYQMQTLDDLIIADATGGAFAVTLPAVVDAQSKFYMVKRLNAGANAVTVVGRNAEPVDGNAAGAALGAQYASVMVFPDKRGTAQWWIV